MQYVIGVDLGGTNLKVGAVSPGGELLFRTELPSGIQEGREAVLKRVLSSIEETRHKIKGRRLAGIGLGIPGIIDIKTGTVIQSPNLNEWCKFSIRDALADKFLCPFFIENDANAFALGEGWVGVAEGIKNFCCLTLGTGVGSGIVLNGCLWRGADGTAGEAGHIVVEPDGAACSCGSWGCLEKYVSASGIVRMAIENKGSEQATPLLRECNGVKGITAKVVASLARKGDSFCISIFKRMARYLGIGMADIVNLLNVEMIVIGGGLSHTSDLFLESAIDEMRKRSFKLPGQHVKVVTAKLGDNGGILGSAYIALKGVAVI